MPVVGISIKRLRELLGGQVDPSGLSDTIGRLGCDVEGTVEVVLYECPRCANLSERLEHEAAPASCTFCGGSFEQAFQEAGRDKVIRLDLLPARPDLMDPGGLARALKGFLKIQTGLPDYPTPGSGISVAVDPSLYNPESYRPYIACAVVRVARMGAGELREIMHLQESLHWAIGRDRKLSSIGVYDLDTLTPPIRYKSAGPDELQFTPLGLPGTTMTPARILDEHPKGIAYAHLLEKLERFPLLVDARGRVLSMPPIINSEETRVTLDSRNLFIDVTGISERNVTDSLNTIVTSLVELGAKAESVEMVFPDGSRTTPDLSVQTIEVDYQAALSWLGIDIDERTFVDTLAKMRLSAKKAHGSAYVVSYPAYRMDVRHQVDIFEDLIIGIGYDNVPSSFAGSITVGRGRPEEHLSSIARSAMLGFGFMEIMSLMQTTRHNHFERLRLSPDSNHVRILNPKSAEFNVVRCHLMTGLLESLEKNRRASPPIDLFEIGNVIIPDGRSETYSREFRRLAFVTMGPGAGYASVRSLLDALLSELGCEGVFEPLSEPFFVEGRGAGVYADGNEIARIGEIHPEVLSSFNLAYPVALCDLLLTEIDIAGGCGTRDQ